MRNMIRYFVSGRIIYLLGYSQNNFEAVISYKQQRKRAVDIDNPF